MLAKSDRLRKELGLFDVYVIATGATLIGFFLLPGLAAAGAGASFPLSYVVAGLFLLPGLLSKAELTTAMPRAGGIYYFLDRSMGPLVGTIGGFGTWFALILKVAFALVGMSAYVSLFFPDLPITPIAAALAILFGVVNLFGSKKSSQLQAVLVSGLLLIVIWFCGIGIGDAKVSFISDMVDVESKSLIATAGLVVVSYMGITKVASVAEEVRNPERNLPLGMFLAFGTAIVMYLVGGVVMGSVVGVERLAANGGDLTPVATAAELMTGTWGKVVMTIAAILAFTSVANAGILSASRYPLAMSRDHVVPRWFRGITRKRIPRRSIYATVGVVLVFVLVFDPMKLAKLAGAFKLLTFALACVAVIVMRESRIDSYDPGYKAPLYPWLQIVGFPASLYLIYMMGPLSILFTVGLVLFGVIWYMYYTRHQVKRGGAVFHIFERLGRRRYEGLDRELRNILKEKGLRSHDPFDQTVAQASVIDLKHATDFVEVVSAAASFLEHRVPGSADEIADEFLRGTRIGATPVTKGVALPHLRKEGLTRAEMIIVRAPYGVVVPADEFHERRTDQIVKALFFLVSPESDPGQHLRILAQIAERVDDEGFMERWTAAETEHELREILLRDDRFVTISLTTESASRSFIGKTMQEVALPDGALAAMISRGTKVMIPKGGTRLKEGDRLTVIGTPETIADLSSRYRDGSD